MKNNNLYSELCAVFVFYTVFVIQYSYDKKKKIDFVDINRGDLVYGRL